jgi:hypothetical protein
MINFFPTTSVVVMPSLKTTEVSAVRLARYRRLFELGIFEIPIGRPKDGYVEVFTSCEFVEAVKKFPEIQEIQVDIRDFNDDHIANIYDLKYPLQSQVENLAQQGAILQNHLALKDLNLSDVVKASYSEGGSYTRQYANSLIGLAQSPSWLQQVINTHPRLKSLPSKLLAFAAYKDFVEAFWSCFKDSYASDPENLSKVTIRQFNQLMALFKPMLRQGHEQEACRLLANSSIQQLVKEYSFSPVADSPVAETTCNVLQDYDFRQQIEVHPDIAHYKKLQSVRQFHYTRLTRKGFSHLNEARAHYWNLVISPFGNIKPSFIFQMSERGVYNPAKLQQYLDQISEYKELEADYLTLSDIAPNNPYAEGSPLQSKSPSSVVGYKAKRSGPHQAQVSFEPQEQLKSQEFWSTLQAAIEDLSKINEIEIKGVAPSLAASLGLNVSRGKVFWYPSLPIHLPALPIAEGVVHPAFLICTSMDETLLTPHTPGKNLGLVPLESGPPAIRCQFPDQIRVLPLSSVLLHPNDQLNIEQALKNR